MGIEDGTTEFKLTRPLEYRFNGNAEMADFILLREPGMDQVKYYLKLKQMIVRAQMDLAKQATEINKIKDAIGEEVKPLVEGVAEMEAQSEEIGQAIALALQTSTVDIGDFLEAFAAMACMKARKPIALVAGHQAMTDALWATLKPDDAFGMAVKWCSFFAMPLAGGEKISSGQPSVSASERMEA